MDAEPRNGGLMSIKHVETGAGAYIPHTDASIRVTGDQAPPLQVEKACEGIMA